MSTFWLNSGGNLVVLSNFASTPVAMIAMCARRGVAKAACQWIAKLCFLAYAVEVCATGPRFLEIGTQELGTLGLRDGVVVGPVSHGPCTVSAKCKGPVTSIVTMATTA